MPEIVAIRVEALVRDANENLRQILGGASADGDARSRLGDETVDAVLDRYLDDTHLHVRFRATAELSDGRAVDADAGTMTQSGPSVALPVGQKLTAVVQTETRAWMEKSVRESIEQHGLRAARDVLTGELAHQGIDVSQGAVRAAPIEVVVDEAALRSWLDRVTDFGASDG